VRNEGASQLTYYVGLPLMLIAAATEAAVLPLFQVGGLQPNLVLVILLAWLMIRGAEEAFVLIPAAGIFLGLVDGAPMGTALLALAPLAVLSDVRGARFREGELILAIVFIVAATIAYHLVYLLVYTVIGASGSWTSALFRATIPTTFLNVAVLLPVYFLVWLASEDRRRGAYA
jgi:rod shape-determining protein MreD